MAPVRSVPYLLGGSGYNKRLRTVLPLLNAPCGRSPADTDLWTDAISVVDSSRSNAAGRGQWSALSVGRVDWPFPSRLFWGHACIWKVPQAALKGCCVLRVT
jgi:hypothetical protein